MRWRRPSSPDFLCDPCGFLCVLCGKDFCCRRPEIESLNRKGRRKGRKEKLNLERYRFFSEVVHHSGTHEKVMLAALSRVHVQLRNAGKKVVHSPAHTEAAKQFNVKTCADLEDSSRDPGLAGVRSKKLQRRALLEIAEASAHTHPGRKPIIREKVSA